MAEPNQPEALGGCWVQRSGTQPTSATTLDVSDYQGVGFLGKSGEGQRRTTADQTVAQTTAEFCPSPPQSP